MQKENREGIQSDWQSHNGAHGYYYMCAALNITIHVSQQSISSAAALWLETLQSLDQLFLQYFVVNDKGFFFALEGNISFLLYISLYFSLIKMRTS